jgi:predicted phosphodiesterase
LCAIDGIPAIDVSERLGMDDGKFAVRFGVIAEIHRAPPGTSRVSWHNELLLDRTDELLGLAMDTIGSETIDALVLLGDVTNSADDASYAAVLEKIAVFEAPVLALPGNHDVDEHGALARFNDHLSATNITVAPAVNQDRPGIAGILVAIERDPLTRSLESFGFPDLSSFAGRTLLIFSHYPLLPMEDRLRDAGLKHAGDVADRQDIADRLFEHDGPVVVVHGHLHVRATEAHANVLHFSCAALVEPPHEVSIISIAYDSVGGLEVRRRAITVESSKVARPPVLAPLNETWSYDGTRWSRTSCAEFA